MKTKQTLLTLGLGLGLGLSFSLTSCSDNDLNSDGGNGNNGNTELTDQEWQKQMALERLLGAMADVDSLPDNWNSKNYIVTTPPTIGTAADEATPYSVRLVPTTSTEEAYREYCSIVGKASNGTPAADTWKMDGIGQLTFTPSSQAGLYATLKVNVQQLPQLQEIRFVPASAIGNNAVKTDEAYYSFGDIIKEGDTYWICVRPVNEPLSLGQSHWCTFQLAEDNFKSLESEALFLPTALGKKQAKSERMAQNLFNLMRVLYNPDLYEGVTTFDKIPSTTFTQQDVERISNAWDDNLNWKFIVPTCYKEEYYYKDEQYKDGVGHDAPSDFFDRFCGDNAALNALYYGYTSKFNFFGKNTYKVYNLKLQLDDKKKLFTATPETPTIEWSKGGDKNFELLTGTTAYENAAQRLMGESYKNVFIVKDRTGGQLQGRFFTDADDDKPKESFESSASGKGITDIFVWKKEKDTKLGDQGLVFAPYFCYGDVETKAADGKTAYAEGEKHFCIKPAYNATSIGDKEVKDNYAWFISNNSQPAAKNQGEAIELKEAQYIAYQLLRAFAYEGKKEGNFESLNGFHQERLGDADKKILSEIYNAFKNNKAISNFDKEKNTDYPSYYSMDVKFYIKGQSKVDAEDNLTNATVLHVRYSPYGNDNFQYTLRQAADDEENKDCFVPVYKYLDDHRYYETYGGENKRMTSGCVRRYFKENLQGVYNSMNFKEMGKE